MRTRVKSTRQIQNEIFDLLKFSKEQRTEALTKVAYEDTNVFVANPKVEASDVVFH
ncbi:hypothetical protein D3C87_650940 [compost metagenome]